MICTYLYACIARRFLSPAYKYIDTSHSRDLSSIYHLISMVYLNIRRYTGIISSYAYHSNNN